MASDRLIQAGEVIADGARRRSAWSERIPATIHTVEDGPDAVRIVAGGEGAPHAITFEAPDAAYWKHPVFATGPREGWHWVKQDPRRFLLPAAEEDSDKAVRVYVRIFDDWGAEFGFRPGI